MCDILTLNVRGLGDDKVRRETFHWLHTNKAKIIMLQETHSSNDKAPQWEAEWGGKIIFSHGASNARGVCILLKNNANYSIHNVYKDNEGRYIILDITIDETRLTLCNLYASNEDQPDFLIF